MTVATKIPREQIQEAIIYYENNNVSMVDVAKKYKYTVSGLKHHLKKQGIKIKTREELPRKYPVNHDYFKEIDVPEKAYFLGLLYADGGIHEPTNTVNLSLKYTDKETLEYLTKLVQDRPLLYCKERTGSKFKSAPQYKIVICSKQIVQDLKKHGCYQAKTYTMEFPTTVALNLMPHFIRGYMDGDGCVCKSLTDPTVSFVGNKVFLSQFQDFLQTHQNIKLTLRDRKDYHDKICMASIVGSKRVVKFLDWIYKDSTVHFDRKFQNYLKLKEDREIRMAKFYSERKCTVSDCENKHYGKNYCHLHYFKLYYKK